MAQHSCMLNNCLLLLYVLLQAERIELSVPSWKQSVHCHRMPVIWLGEDVSSSLNGVVQRKLCYHIQI